MKQVASTSALTTVGLPPMDASSAKNAMTDVLNMPYMSNFLAQHPCTLAYWLMLVMSV